MYTEREKLRERPTDRKRETEREACRQKDRN